MKSGTHTSALAFGVLLNMCMVTVMSAVGSGVLGYIALSTAVSVAATVPAGLLLVHRRRTVSP